MVDQDHQLFLTMVGLFCVVQVIRSKCLFLYQITHIFFIMTGRPPDISSMSAVSRLTKFPGNDSCALFFQTILTENKFYQLRFLWINDQVSSLYIISKERSSKDNALFHPPGLPPFDPAGGPAALLLGKGGHNGQPQFRVRLQSVDIIVCKYNGYAQCL